MWNQLIGNHWLGIFWYGQIRPWALLQGQTRIEKLESAYNSLIIGPRGLQYETNLQEIMGWESSDVVRFDFGSLLQGQAWIQLVYYQS